MCHDDFFWEVNDLLESSYQTKRLEAEEKSLLWWFVDFERVAVRDAPSPSAKVVGVLRQGALVQAEKLELIDPADGRPCARWLKLHKNEHQFFKSTTGERTRATATTARRLDACSKDACARGCRRAAPARRWAAGRPWKTLESCIASDRLDRSLAAASSVACGSCSKVTSRWRRRVSSGGLPARWAFATDPKHPFRGGAVHRKQSGKCCNFWHTSTAYWLYKWSRQLCAIVDIYQLTVQRSV